MEIIPIKKSDEKSGPTRQGLTYKKYFHQGYRDRALATLANVLFCIRLAASPLVSRGFAPRGIITSFIT